MKQLETLKTFEEMTEQEKIEFLSKFREWGDNRFQELRKYAGAWENCQIKSFEDGLQLLSAFSICREFVQESLMFRDYQRRLERMQYFIDLLRKRTGMDKILTIPSTDRQEHITLADKNGDGKPEDLSKKINEYIPEAPKHISEYMHLLSPDLQARCGDIQSIRAQYAKHAEMAKELSDAGSDEKIVADHANIAVKLQQQLDAIYREVDAERAKLADKPADTASAATSDTSTAPTDATVGDKSDAESDAIKTPENKAEEKTETAAEAETKAETAVEAETAAEAEADTNAAAKEAAEKETVTEAEADTNAATEADAADGGETSSEATESAETAAESTESASEAKKAKPAKMTKEVIDAMPEGEEKFKAKESRIRSNKTYLNRSDVKETPERIKEVALRRKELEEWGVPFDK